MPSDFGVVAVVSSILQLSFVRRQDFGLGTTDHPDERPHGRRHATWPSPPRRSSVWD
jgi:hypothetical protein